MKINEYSNFIGVYDNVYNDGFCQHMISEFERLETAGAGSDRLQSEQTAKTFKDDYQISLGPATHQLKHFNPEMDLMDEFFKGLQLCFDHYVQQYAVLDRFNVKATICKLQRTRPGQGYHIWHCEQSSITTASRVLSYMVYLNTLQPSEAGETEFLYQQVRYRPVENTCVIWPAAYTHTHRGNVVFGDTAKYIATGWFYLN